MFMNFIMLHSSLIVYTHVYLEISIEILRFTTDIIIVNNRNF